MSSERRSVSSRPVAGSKETRVAGFVGEAAPKTTRPCAGPECPRRARRPLEAGGLERAALGVQQLERLDGVAGDDACDPAVVEEGVAPQAEDPGREAELGALERSTAATPSRYRFHQPVRSEQ